MIEVKATPQDNQPTQYDWKTRTSLPEVFCKKMFLNIL